MLTACSPRGAIPAFPQCLLQQASQIVPSTPPPGVGTQEALIPGSGMLPSWGTAPGLCGLPCLVMEEP